MTQVEVTPQHPLRLLLSYHYYKKEPIGPLLDECFASKPLDLFADSGAFSAFTLGQKIDPTAYEDWCLRWASRFNVIAALDVIGDATATARNTEALMAVFAKEHPSKVVLPTFHAGEPYEVLDHWCSRANYIAVGAMVPLSKDRGLLDAFLNEVFQRVPAHVKVHGFGMTNWPLVVRYPWASVDSSAWTACFRFATLALFDPAKGQFVALDMRKPKEALPHANLLASYGLRPTDIKSKHYDRARLCRASLMAWRAAERWLSDRAVYSVTKPDSICPPNSPRAIATYVAAGRAHKTQAAPAHIAKYLVSATAESGDGD